MIRRNKNQKKSPQEEKKRKRKVLQKCRQAIKILEQYERLAEKQAAKIPPNRLTNLNLLRDTGMLTINHLPGSLHKKFPREFQNMTLAEIREYFKELL